MAVELDWLEVRHSYRTVGHVVARVLLVGLEELV